MKLVIHVTIKMFVKKAFINSNCKGVKQRKKLKNTVLF